MADWDFGEIYDTDIVGESNYQTALRKCFKDNESIRSENTAITIVDLVYEPHNKFDKNAVAVISKYGLIGYLSKDNAIRYRHLCEGDTATMSVMCKIFKGKQGIYGAWIDLDLEDLPNSYQSLRKYNKQTSKNKTASSVSSPPANALSKQAGKLNYFVIFLVLLFLLLILF